MIDPLAEQLTRRIGELSPRRDDQNGLADSLKPSLAYGRHRGPAPGTARRAAVAIAILRRADGSRFIPLTRRPKSLRHHGGQISLPGGKVETGESDLQAAQREFAEELGVDLDNAVYCGSLPPVYVYASDNLVSPLVLVADAPAQSWQPDLLEVDELIELPLEVLTGKLSIVQVSRIRRLTHLNQVVGEYKYRSPSIRYRDHRIWGATAMMLGELVPLLESVVPHRK